MQSQGLGEGYEVRIWRCTRQHQHQPPVTIPLGLVRVCLVAERPVSLMTADGNDDSESKCPGHSVIVPLPRAEPAPLVGTVMVPENPGDTGQFCKLNVAVN